MKKLLFIFTTLLIFSCSSSDDSSKETVNGDFHVPTWLIGTWKFGDSSTSVSFTFPSNDICFSYNGTVGQCQQGLIDISRKGGMNVKVIETSSSTFYSAEIKYSSGQSTTYAFKKISNNSIEWTGATGVELTKQ